MMTDVVREVKEAARIREEALMGRVQSLLDERNWLMNESNLKISRDIDELKVKFLIDINIIFCQCLKYC